MSDTLCSTRTLVWCNGRDVLVARATSGGSGNVGPSGSGGQGGSGSGSGGQASMNDFVQQMPVLSVSSQKLLPAPAKQQTCSFCASGSKGGENIECDPSKDARPTFYSSVCVIVPLEY